MRVVLKSALMLTTIVVGVAQSFAQGGARSSIIAGNKKLSDAVSKGDTATIASVYASDAEVVPAQGDVIKGRAAIETMWRSVLDSGVATFDIVTTDVDTQGDIADERGTYAMKTKDGHVFQHGKYNNVWKKDAGQWKLQRNAWTKET